MVAPRPARAVLCVVPPVPPLATARVPLSVSVPLEVIGEPVNVKPVVPPDAATEVTVPPDAVDDSVPADSVRPVPIVISSIAPALAVVRPSMRAVLIVRPLEPTAPDAAALRLERAVPASVAPVPPLATGSVPVTCVARDTLLRAPPSVRLPDEVTVPVSVMPLTVPVPLTELTVPLPEPAPIAVRNEAASSAETVLSALKRGNVTALGLGMTKMLPPSVVAPSAVRAAPAAVAPVPPLAMATTPVTFAAVPVVFWFNVGTSAATIARNVGVPAAPLGAARKVFAVCEAKFDGVTESVPPSVRLPEVVTVPVSVIPLTVPVPPTEVTVPTN